MKMVLDLIIGVSVSSGESIKFHSQSSFRAVLQINARTMHSSLYVGKNQGTPALHVGSTPGTAGPASMSGGGTLAPGGFQAGSFQPRRRVNQTIGQLTNHSVPRTSIMRRLQTKGDEYIQKGQFVFAQCGPAPMSQSARGSEGIDSLFNLPLLNYYLAKLSSHPDYQNMTAAAVASKFVPHGVMLNSVGDPGREERIVVNTVRGYADTFNVWGDGAYDGDSLYFVYKQIYVDGLHERMQFSYDFAGTPQTVDVSNDSKVWQVIPVCCRGDKEPTLDDLKSGVVRGADLKSGVVRGSDERLECKGIARYVGRVQHARNASGAGICGHQNISGLSRELILMTNVCQMTIFLDI